VEQENSLLLAGPGEKYKKATNTSWKEIHIHVHSIKVVGTFEVLYHIISNNPRLGDGVGLLAFLFNSNSEKLYVLAPCTHMANILRPPWLKIATSCKNFLEIIDPQDWLAIKSMFLQYLNSEPVTWSWVRKLYTSSMLKIFFKGCQFYFFSNCRRLN